MKEGASIALSAKAGGARKIYWVLQDGNQSEILAVDRFKHTFDAGRVAEDKSVALQFKAVFASGVKTRTIRLAIQENVPNPAYTLNAPKRWNGRDELVILPSISNLKEMKSKGAGELNYSWKVSGMATISESGEGRLVLKRAQNTGGLTVELALDNGGAVVSRSVRIAVIEPKRDAWVKRIPSAEEKPVDHQFYARDDTGQGTLHYRGMLKESADSVFLRLYAGDKLIDTQSQKIGPRQEVRLVRKLAGGSDRLSHGVWHQAWRGGNDFGKSQRFGLRRRLRHSRASPMPKPGRTNASSIRTGVPWLRSFGTPSTNKDRAPGPSLGQRPVFQRGPESSSLPNWVLGRRAGQDAYRKHIRSPSASSMGRREEHGLTSTSATRPPRRT